MFRSVHQIRVPEGPLFARCTRRERRAVGQLGTGLVVEAGTMLTLEGRTGREFFVIKSGEASCSVRGVIKARFRQGDFFGEMALVDGGPRTATVIAETPMELMVFGANEFRAMLEASAGVRHRLLIELAARLRAIDAAA